MIGFKHFWDCRNEKQRISGWNEVKIRENALWNLIWAKIEQMERYLSKNEQLERN